MDDVIYRQAAIDAFYVQSDDDGWWCGTAQDAEELLKGLPSAQPERKKGKWKHLGGDEWCCNQCGNVIYTEGHWEHPLSNDRKMYHCNICGADMRGTDAD